VAKGRNAVSADLAAGAFGAALTHLLAAWLVGCGGPIECPGGGTQRCLNGVTPQWCSIGGGSGPDVPEPGLMSSASNTATWQSYETCEAPSTCIMLPDTHAGRQAVCSLSKSPVEECSGAYPSNCFEGYAVACAAGYPSVSDVAVCPNVCVKGICSLSESPDPKCPGDGAHTQYCSARGPIACEDGYDLDPAFYGAPIDSPCGGSGDAGAPDAQVGDAAGLADLSSGDAASVADAHRAGVCPADPGACGAK
jgi:hypothetical protein